MRIERDAIPDGAVKVIDNLKAYRYSAYLVGGCVRDLVMGCIPHDWDICTSARPEQTINILNHYGYHYHTEGIEFGTVVAIVDNEEYEITTYRTEGSYLDSRHPSDVNFRDNIADDLARRDFTINAMAYDPTNGYFVDKFGGLYDIKTGVINAIGNPSERFKEDALRILRALRFSIRYGFSIGDKTSEAMHSMVKRLDSVSRERVTSEFKKMLTCGKPVKHAFMEYNWLISYIIKELKPCIGLDQNNKYHKHNVYEHILYVVDGCDTSKFEIKLAALLHDIGKPAALVKGDDGYSHYYGHEQISYEMSKRILKEVFSLKAEQYDGILELVLNHDMQIAGTRKSVKRAMNKLGEGVLRDLLILRDSDKADHISIVYGERIADKATIEKFMQEIISEGQCFSLKDLKINGSDIMGILKIKPGKVVGEILNYLLEKVINEEIDNEKESLTDEVLRYHSERARLNNEEHFNCG